MLHLTVLGSGSAGNCAVVSSGATHLLVDAGLSARQIARRMEKAGLEAEAASAILLTHEHGDHTKGIDVFCRGREVPVYANPLTRESLAGSLKSAPRWKLIDAGSAFAIGDIEVRAFSVAHDAADPVGYVFDDGESRLGVVSDLGYATAAVRQALRGVQTLFMEANYDEAMLANDTKRPWSTKQRIMARHGHLSNAQAADLAAEVAEGGALERIVLGHLSRDCNDPDAAIHAVRTKLALRGWSHIEILCAEQEEPLRPMPACAKRAQPAAPVAAPQPPPRRDPRPVAPAGPAASSERREPPTRRRSNRDSRWVQVELCFD
ncbi:MAG: MBL fold metallo-hydrolase [Verrucomicrobiales bacterium]